MIESKFLVPSQYKILSQSPRQLITYYLWYFIVVAACIFIEETDKKNKTPSLI